MWCVVDGWWVVGGKGRVIGDQRRKRGWEVSCQSVECEEDDAGSDKDGGKTGRKGKAFHSPKCGKAYEKNILLQTVNLV